MSGYSKKYKEIINTAKNVCVGNEIKVEHLIAAILHTESDACNLLSQHLTVEQVNAIKTRFPLNEQANIATEVSIDADANNVMEQAVLERDKYNAKYLKTEHLLLALAHYKKLPLNITYETISQQVKGLYSTPEYNATVANTDTQSVTQTPESQTSGIIPPTPQTNKVPTPILDQFGTDLTKMASEDKLDPVIGREEEIKRLCQVLARRRKNNPVLIGDAGCGKTAIVEHLATLIVKKEVPEVLLNKRIIAMEVSNLVAGTKFRGEFEERIKKLVDELKQCQDVIVFFDELHTIMGAGGGSGSTDAANMLKPALSRGEIVCIGSTTNDEYKKIEKDGAMDRRFQKIRVAEPTFTETIHIVKNIKKRYEDFHLVSYSDEAIEACVKLTDRYINDRVFPDKAIDALDEAGAAVRITSNIPDDVKSLQNEIEEVIKLKQQCVKETKFEMAAEYKAKETELKNQLTALTEKHRTELELNKKVVTAKDVANVVSIMAGVPSESVSEDEIHSVLELPTNMKKDIIGQDQAIDLITRSILRNKAGLNDNKRPIGTFLFIGSTGVGKTHIAKMLAKNLFNDEKNMIRIDMSEYMEKHTVSRLIGAPPGYVGHGEGGQLTDAVKNKPYSVILLDEVEKAHSDVWNIMLQVFDDGQLTDSTGRTVSFKNTIIIMTSNVGTREAASRGNGLGFGTSAPTTSNIPTMSIDIINKELKNKFSPEFLNRIDEIITFNKLSKDGIRTIIDLELKKLISKLIERNITINLTDNAKDFILEKGWDENMGARPLKRAIQKNITDELSIMLMTKDLTDGDTVIVEHNQGADQLSFDIHKPQSIKSIESDDEVVEEI